MVRGLYGDIGITGRGGEGEASRGADEVISGVIERGEIGGGVGLPRESDLDRVDWDRSSAGSRERNSP